MRRALLSIAVLLPLIAGCGAAQTPEQAVSDSPKKTAKAGTSRLAASFDGKPLVTAVLDYEEETGVVEMRGKAQQIVTRDAVYTRITAFDLQTEKLGKKQWIRNDAASESRGLFQPIAANPAELLDLLSTASDFEKVDTGEERGVAVTRYRAKLGVERALKELPERERVVLRETIRQYWPDGAKAAIPLELAIDEKGRLSKVAVTVPDDERLVLEFYDYGVEVDPKPPPADEVVTWQELATLMADEEAE